MPDVTVLIVILGVGWLAIVVFSVFAAAWLSKSMNGLDGARKSAYKLGIDGYVIYHAEYKDGCTETRYSDGSISHSGENHVPHHAFLPNDKPIKVYELEKEKDE